MNTVKLNTGAAIYDALVNDSSVYELVGTKVYPMVAEADTTYPYIVYRRTSLQPASNKDIYVFNSVTDVEINIYADGYSQSIELAQRVCDALLKYRNRGWEIKLLDSSEDWIDDTYVTNITTTVTDKT